MDGQYDGKYHKMVEMYQPVDSVYTTDISIISGQKCIKLLTHVSNQKNMEECQNTQCDMLQKSWIYICGWQAMMQLAAFIQNSFDMPPLKLNWVIMLCIQKWENNQMRTTMLSFTKYLTHLTIQKYLYHIFIYYINYWAEFPDKNNCIVKQLWWYKIIAWNKILFNRPLQSMSWLFWCLFLYFCIFWKGYISFYVLSQRFQARSFLHHTWGREKSEKVDVWMPNSNTQSSTCYLYKVSLIARAMLCHGMSNATVTLAYTHS